MLVVNQKVNRIQCNYCFITACKYLFQFGLRRHSFGKFFYTKRIQGKTRRKIEV